MSGRGKREAIMNNINGKCAIVTGGTKGIGLAIARGLVEHGAKVLICARKEDEIYSAVSRLNSEFGERAYGITCDVSDHKQVSGLFAEAETIFGRLDILINNAGMGSYGSVEEMTVEEWGATIGTNLSGVFYCCHSALPSMKKSGGGYIINIGSLAGKNPIAGMSAYCASKFGLLGFTESLMQEVRYDHIRVTCLMPGSVNTGFGRGGRKSGAEWKLQPEDVAEVVINLLEMDPRALSSRVELRPSEPKK